MPPMFMFTNFDKFQTLESKQVREKCAKLKNVCFDYKQRINKE